MEPSGAFPDDASRLDPRPDLWDAEIRVRLTDVHLDAVGAAWLGALAAGDPGRGRAVLLEAVAERGGLPRELADAVAIGTVEARGPVAPHPVDAGARVALPPPVTAYPLWLHDVAGWHGGPHVPCDGHLLVHACSPLVTVPAALPPPVVAGTLRAAHARAAAERWAPAGGHTLVLGATSTAGALAARAAAQRSRVVGTVTSLQEARLLAALGDIEALVLPLDDLQQAVASVHGRIGGAPGVVVLTGTRVDDARLAGLAVAPDGMVVVTDRGAPAAQVVQAAAGVGSFPRVEVGRTLRTATDLQAAVDEVATHEQLAALVAWRSGSGGPPAAARPYDPEEP